MTRLLLILVLALAWWAPASAACADPITAIFTAVGAWLATGTIAATIASFVINVAISLALTAGANKLFGSKSGAASLQDRQAAVLGLTIGESPREAIFGRAATGGTLVDGFNFGGTNRTDWEVLVIKVADHKCDALEGFYIGDTFYAFSADGVQSGFNSQLEVYWKNGDPAQAASSYLVTNSAVRLYGAGSMTWTSADVMASMAYVVVAYKADAPNAASPVWPQGRPGFKFLVRGKLCYDPRQDSTVAGGSGAHRWATPSTWEWYENAAICDYNYDRGIYAKDQVASPEHLLIGRGLTEVEADPARVAARANICDELVALKAGGTEKRYRCGGVIFASETFAAVKQKFADAMAGDIVKRNGGVEVLPGVAQSTVREITDANLVLGEDISYEPFLTDNDRVNTVIARYVEPSQLWKDHAAPIRRSLTDIANDQGLKLADVPLDVVTSGTQAQRIGEIKRRLARKERRAGVVLAPPFSNLEDGDWIGWTSDRYFAGARIVFRVEAYTVKENWRIVLVLREIGTDAYSWTAATDEGTDGEAPVNSAPTLTALGLGSPTVAAHALTGANSAVFPAVKATWATPVDPAIRAVVLEVRKLGSTDVAATRLDRPNDGLIITTDGVPSGVSVEARVVPVSFDPNRTVTPSSWTTLTATAFNIIAAGITGQGSLATLNAVTWATQVTGVGKPDDFANKVVVWRQVSAPTTPGVNDIWVKLDGSGNQLAVYAWNGSIWVLGADVTGLFTAAGIAGQGALATLNVVDGVRLAAAQGTNAIVDAGFRFLSPYWVNVTSSGGTWTSSVGTSGNLRYFQRQATGTPGAGVTNSMGQGFHAGLLPCKPGDRIEASAYLAGSGVASASVLIEWFNSSGAFLTNTTAQSLSGAPAGSSFSGGINGQTRLAGFATAPASAAYAELLVVWSTTAAASPFMQVALPLIRQANAGQTDITPWSPGVEAQLGADVTSTNTAAGISGQGGFATANYYRQSSDPGAVAAGSIWVDTSGAFEIVKQRIGGVWVTIANNASAAAGFYLTLDHDQLVTVGPGTAGPISSVAVTATPHNNSGAVTYQWLQIASDPAGHTITISAATSATTQFTATVNASNDPYGTFVCIATDASGNKAQVILPVSFFF